MADADPKNPGNDEGLPKPAHDNQDQDNKDKNNTGNKPKEEQRRASEDHERKVTVLCKG